MVHTWPRSRSPRGPAASTPRPRTRPWRITRRTSTRPPRSPHNPKAAGVRPACVDEAPRRVLDRLGIRPRKRLGQHFLVDSRVALRHVGHAAIGSSDTVLGNGPGAGVLTPLLAERARHGVAIEADRRFAAYLRGSLPPLEGGEGAAPPVEWAPLAVMGPNLPDQNSS